jgi:site-specific DNA recombinase
VAIDLRGELAAMLSLCAGTEPQKASAIVTEEALQIKMVAGTGSLSVLSPNHPLDLARCF